MTTTREHLEAAREAIRDERDWCQNQGIKGDARCAAFALSAVRGCCTEESARVALRRTAFRLYPEGDLWGPGEVAIPSFNDTHTHAEVIELFNLAIADEIATEEAHSRHMVEEQEREAVEDSAAPLVFA